MAGWGDTSRTVKRAYDIHGRCWVFRGIYDNTCIFYSAAYTLHLLGMNQAIEYITQRRLAFSRPESQWTILLSLCSYSHAEQV